MKLAYVGTAYSLHFTKQASKSRFFFHTAAQANTYNISFYYTDDKALSDMSEKATKYSAARRYGLFEMWCSFFKALTMTTEASSS